MRDPSPHVAPLDGTWTAAMWRRYWPQAFAGAFSVDTATFVSIYRGEGVVNARLEAAGGLPLKDKAKGKAK